VGSSFGQAFRLTTFGESQAERWGWWSTAAATTEPAEADIQVELDRRRPGQSRISTPRQEADRVRILSGVFDGSRWAPRSP